MRTSLRARALAALLLTLALIAASCSGDSTTDTEEGGDSSSNGASADGTSSDGDGGDGDSGGDADADTSEDGTDGTDGDADTEDDGADAEADEPEPEPEPEEPAGPDVRTLALMPDPVGSTDPLETVNHLPSVQVFTTETGIAFVFDSLPEVGNRILIAPADHEVWCDMWQDGENLRVECGGYNLIDNVFLEQMPIEQVDMALGYGFIAPMTVSGGVVTLTHNGTDYAATEVRVAQEPAFVQIDVNTGGLAAEVVRTVGIVTGAELEAALA